MGQFNVFHSQRRQRGFSLVELMVVVVIIGILSAIAYPAYTRYVVRTHRAAVQSYMLDLSLKQTSYMADSRTYATDTQIKQLVPTPTTISSRYDILVEPVSTPLGYTITATPVTGSSQAGDSVLTLNNQGVKTPSSAW